MQSPSDLTRFLWGERPNGWAAIWDKTTKRTTPIRAADHVGLDNCVQSLCANGGEVYFGTGLQAQPPLNGRGKADDICAISGPFFDFDVGRVGHKGAAYPQSMQECRDFIATLPLKPSILVNTGGGFHAYWAFTELWVFGNEADRQKAAAMLAGWQRRIIELGSRHGWKFDFTGDLARVLRLPGTWNLKIPGQPRPVTVEYWSDQNALQH